MGCQSSKIRDSDSQFTKDLRSYEDACKKDPRLQSFDANVRESTNHVINSLATGNSDIRSSDSFKDVTKYLLNLNQDVVNFILESREDIWNNPDLFPLVKEYFDSSVKTMDFCTELESCVTRACTSQMHIQAAITHFEKEVELQDGMREKKYVKTLEELQKFVAAGNPFTPKFFKLFLSVYEQQESMLEKIESYKEKLDKKLKRVKIWRRVSNVLFVSVFASVMIFTVVAAAIAAPPVVVALASALAAPMGSVGSWCNLLWNRYQEALEEKQGLVDSINLATFITIKEMESIKALAEKLIVKIEPLLKNAEFAIREEDFVKLMLDEIKKTMVMFMETFEELDAQAHSCHRHIIQGRTMILKRINYLVNKELLW